MKTIVIANQKGGVGKTTTTMNLAAGLHLRGKRVLVIDSDPQANLTSYLGVDPGSESFPSLRTLDEMYLSKRELELSEKKNFIAQTESGIHLIPSDGALSGVEYYLFSRADKEGLLQEFLWDLTADYDFVLIDTPPAMNLITLNAMVAADEVLIPVQPEFFGLEGISKLKASIEDIKRRWNPRLKILGILPSIVSGRRKLTSEVLSVLSEEFGTLVFESKIHDNASVTESTGHGQSVFAYDRHSKGAADFDRAADEVIRRLGLTVELEGDSAKGASK